MIIFYKLFLIFVKKRSKVNIMDIIIDESLKTGYVIYRDDEYEYHLGNFDL